MGFESINRYRTGRRYTAYINGYIKERRRKKKKLSGRLKKKEVKLYLNLNKNSWNNLSICLRKKEYDLNELLVGGTGSKNIGVPPVNI